MPELFFNNAPLQDDRTIGYHEIQEGSIIETCSNPVWVSLLYAILGDIEVCFSSSRCLDPLSPSLRRSMVNRIKTGSICSGTLEHS